MDYFMKMPRNKKETALFMAIVSLISVNIIAPLISCFEAGFSLNTWVSTIKVIPFLWVCIIVLVLASFKPASILTSKIISDDDSFNAHIVINIMCTVIMISAVMTVAGTWIGCRNVSIDPIIHFFYKWPRNFAVAFAVESLIAQPIARKVLFAFHTHKGKSSIQTAELNAE